MRVAIIGGGAAGFFSAISAKENFPDTEIHIFEKSSKVLSKVKISGGGRCNVTNAAASNNALAACYPRGEKFLKKAFHTFNNKDAVQWFENRGVPLVTQEDQCIFPQSQNSQSVIDCFFNQTKALNINVQTRMGVKSIVPSNNQLLLRFIDDKQEPQLFDKVIVTTGGSPKRRGLDWLQVLGHKIVNPVPSLFTFNMPTEKVKSLMGIVVEDTIVRIQGTKFISDGPLLITHWGMSGPGILKLSAFAARYLHDSDYNFKIQVNWVSEKNAQHVTEQLQKLLNKNGGKNLLNIRPSTIPERLWHFLLEKHQVPLNKKASELGKKEFNKLVELLTNDTYSVKGKTTFKEEFVTAGGVSLDDIDHNTMQSKVCPNLYFAGEVMDIDGITGGFNFQAAWTTAYIAGKLH